MSFNSSQIEDVIKYVNAEFSQLTTTKALLYLLGALGFVARARLIVTSMLVFLQTFVLPGKSVSLFYLDCYVYLSHVCA